jgi:hypothetical protein
MFEFDALELSLSGFGVRKRRASAYKDWRDAASAPERAQNILLDVRDRVIQLTLPVKSASWRYSARVARKRSRT